MPAPKDPIAKALWKERMSAARTGEKNHNYGKPVSDERKQKQRKSMEGKSNGENNPMFGVRLCGDKNHMFGKHHTSESIQKISQSKIGNSPAWNKGIPAIWLKDIPRTDEVKQKISVSNIGKVYSEETIEKLRKTKLETTPTGKDSVHWKGGITKLNLHIRTLPRHKLLCKEVMESVDYTDIFTNVRGGLLVCHHVIPQNIIISLYKITTIDEARNCPLLFDKHNLIVMLSSAHDKFHNLYGDDKNIFELSKDQIAELYDGVEINPSANPRWANH